MQRDLTRFTRSAFDLLVVGGGITGACIAHDATLRGLSVALIDRADFGGATSSASSRLLHSGIRYLQQGSLTKARASTRERIAFIRIAPHLVAPLPMLVPARGRGLQGRTALSVAATAFGAFTADIWRGVPDRHRHAPPPRVLGPGDLRGLVPAFAAEHEITGALEWHESEMHSPQRMTLAFLNTASGNGAVLGNYCAATRLLRRGSQVCGVAATDAITGNDFEIAAKLVVNASGPWLDVLNSQVHATRSTRRASWPSKGMHILTRQLLSSHGLALSSRHRARTLIDRGSRHIFILPWRGHSQIGTTNTRHDGSPDDVRPTAAEIRDLLADVNASFPGANLTDRDVTHAYGGLFPLTHATDRPEIYQVTGDHQIIDYSLAGIPGYLSVLGAKFTLARLVAQRAVDRAEQQLRGRVSPCRTAQTLLAGARSPSAPWTADVDGRQLDDRIRVALHRSYGAHARDVAALAATMPDGVARLVAGMDVIKAEVVYAVRHEMAVHVDDVLFRRTGLGTLGYPGADVVATTASLMAAELGWSAGQVSGEIEQVTARFPMGCALPGPGPVIGTA